MSLTELSVRQAKPREKRYTMSDGKGLILEIRPSGKKYWIARLWIGGKETRRCLGSYPDMNLKTAREENFLLRKKASEGGDQALASVTFGAVAEEWLKNRAEPRFSPSYMRSTLIRLNKHILPNLGPMDVKDITPQTILAICRKLEGYGHIETSHRIKQLTGQIFRYAMASGYVDGDPSGALSGALQPNQPKHYSAITDPDAIGALMRGIDAYPQRQTRIALWFSALVFCRPGEVRHAEWTEINWTTEEWRIPAEKMKMSRPHVVPLARQTIALLREIEPLTGDSKWIFPSARRDGRPMSENAIRVALRSMGYSNDEMTAHGFRAMFSTVANETGMWPPDVIERQLAHVEQNSVRAAYNHAEYLDKRREMMQWWADWLDARR